MTDSTGLSDKLVGIIISENNTIPIIQTDEKGKIIDHINLDSAKVAENPRYVEKKLKEFRSENDPIDMDKSTGSNQEKYLLLWRYQFTEHR